MLNNYDPELRKNLSNMFIKLAKKIEEDDDFAKLLLADLITQQEIKDKKSSSNKQPKTTKQPKKANDSPLDVYSILQSDGEKGLLASLEKCEVEQLKKIISYYGLDSTNKYRRWRKKERFIDLILHTVKARMTKGSAFIKE